VLGPTAFAREIASPLLHEVGDRWERGELSVAAEHLVSAVTRSILSVALRGGSRGVAAPSLLFATPAGEPHEFGLLIAAVAAVGAGAEVTYLGSELPAEDLARAAERVQPAAVALSFVQLPTEEARRYLTRLRRSLPAEIEIWSGGPAAPREEVSGVQRLDTLDDLESRVGHLLRLSALA
jgi:methylmalonyl-CoA mutase cobalamin-binding subunit